MNTWATVLIGESHLTPADFDVTAPPLKLVTNYLRRCTGDEDWGAVAVSMWRGPTVPT